MQYIHKNSQQCIWHLLSLLFNHMNDYDFSSHCRADLGEDELERLRPNIAPIAQLFRILLRKSLDYFGVVFCFSRMNRNYTNGFPY